MKKMEKKHDRQLLGSCLLLKTNHHEEIIGIDIYGKPNESSQRSSISDI